MSDFAEYLRIMGGMHDARFAGITWNVAERTVEVLIDNMYWDFESYPEYPGEISGRFTFRGVASVDLGVSTDRTGIMINSCDVEEGAPPTFLMRFTPGGELRIVYTSVAFPPPQLANTRSGSDLQVQVSQPEQLLDELRTSASLRHGAGHVYPGLSSSELDALAAQLTFPLGEEARALLSLVSGFRCGPLEDVDFTGRSFNFEWQEGIPAGIPIAKDRCGNHWVIDVDPVTGEWHSVLFACHDPIALVVQSRNLYAFVDRVLHVTPYPEAEMDDCVKSLIERPAQGISRESALGSSDPELRPAAAAVDDEYVIVDLRTEERCAGVVLSKVDDVRRNSPSLVVAVRDRRRRRWWT